MTEHSIYTRYNQLSIPITNIFSHSPTESDITSLQWRAYPAGRLSSNGASSMQVVWDRMLQQQQSATTKEESCVSRSRSWMACMAAWMWSRSVEAMAWPGRVERASAFRVGNTDESFSRVGETVMIQRPLKFEASGIHRLFVRSHEGSARKDMVSSSE